MTTDKYANKITSASKATATRDLTDLLAKGLLWVESMGKVTRCGECAGPRSACTQALGKPIRLPIAIK